MGSIGSPSPSQSAADPVGPVVLEPRHDGLPPGDLAVVAQAVRAGGLVALPTDTVYGVAANAALPEAVHRLFQAKGRPQEKALAVLIADTSDVARYAREVRSTARALMERFWPGPLTLALTRTDAICGEAVGGGSTVALRLPDHDLARSIIRAAGVPVAVSSANRSGDPSTTRAEDVLAMLAPWLAVLVRVDIESPGVPSTVIDVTVSPPRVTRWGGVSREQIEDLIGEVADGAG